MSLIKIDNGTMIIVLGIEWSIDVKASTKL